MTVVPAMKKVKLLKMCAKKLNFPVLLHNEGANKCLYSFVSYLLSSSAHPPSCDKLHDEGTSRHYILI